MQVCKLSWLSTTEAFPVDGLRTAPQRRRDMRSGKYTYASLHMCVTGVVAGCSRVPGQAVLQSLVFCSCFSCKHAAKAFSTTSCKSDDTLVRLVVPMLC